MKKLLILVAAVAVILVSCGGNSLSFENPDSKKDVIASGVAPADIEAWESEVDADFAAVIEALGNDGDLEALEAFDAKYGTDMAETGARYAAARAARSGSSSSSGSSSYPAMQNMPFNKDGAVYISGGTDDLVGTVIDWVSPKTLPSLKKSTISLLPFSSYLINDASPLSIIKICFLFSIYEVIVSPLVKSFLTN